MSSQGIIVARLADSNKHLFILKYADLETSPPLIITNVHEVWTQYTSLILLSIHVCRWRVENKGRGEIKLRTHSEWLFGVTCMEIIILAS